MMQDLDAILPRLGEARLSTVDARAVLTDCGWQPENTSTTAATIAYQHFVGLILQVQRSICYSVALCLA
jgi:hypothetical protein